MRLYCQSASLGQDMIAFTAENDVWIGDLHTQRAERLSVYGCSISQICLHPDGQHIALTSTHEGFESIYLLNLNGGAMQRLTYFAGAPRPVMWKNDTQLIFASGHEDPFGIHQLYCCDIHNIAHIQTLNLPHASFMTMNPENINEYVVQRYGYGYMSWKNYQGGCAAQLWSYHPNKEPQRLMMNAHNCLRPIWMGDDIYYLSDHGGQGALHAWNLSKNTSRQVSPLHLSFDAFGTSTDGQRLAFISGGDVYLHMPHDTETKMLEFKTRSTYAFQDSYTACPIEHFQHSDVHPKGHMVAITTRGKLFIMTPHAGVIQEITTTDADECASSVFYRDAIWSFDGRHIIAIQDHGCDEKLHVFNREDNTNRTLGASHLGRILKMKSCPVSSRLFFYNHENRLMALATDVDDAEVMVLDASAFGPIDGFDISPDGNWVVYSIPVSSSLSQIRLYDMRSQKCHHLTLGDGYDFSPGFDADGKYISFLSMRALKSVWDPVRFNLNFSRHHTQVFICPLNSNDISPFIKPLLECATDEETLDGKNTSEMTSDVENSSDTTLDDHKEQCDTTQSEALMSKEVHIDVENMFQRIISVPLPPHAYTHAWGLSGGKLMVQYDPISPDVLEEKQGREDAVSGAGLLVYDFNALKHDVIIQNIKHCELSAQKKWMIYTTPSKRLRVLRAGERGDDQDPSFRNGGWVDVARILLKVHPKEEWMHMFNAAWRLQRDFFWKKNMGEVDWSDVYQRYIPLVQRVGSTTDLMRIISEMQGELRTSHAYISPGNKEEGEGLEWASLAMRAVFDDSRQAWKIMHIDSSMTFALNSPLHAPGLQIEVGHYILAINGQRTHHAHIHFDALLMGRAGQLTCLRVADDAFENVRDCFVRPLSVKQLKKMRYDQWVESRRAFVKKHHASFGYVHIPDMGMRGFECFYKHYLQDYNCDGLVVDARYNGGGSISPLIIDVLSRRRIGFDQSRHQGRFSLPFEAPAGPMVALINPYTGSDGDIFGYTFKKLNLGPVIGQRSWGGVVGISPRISLIDGTMTTQPEYAFIELDGDRAIENYGVDPDIEIEMPLHFDIYGADDPQLFTAVQQLKNQIK